MTDWGLAKWGTYKGSVAFAENLAIATEIEDETYFKKALKQSSDLVNWKKRY